MSAPYRSPGMIDDPPLHGDDAPIVEQVAQDLIRYFGAKAPCYVREQAEIAAERDAAFVVETWHDIADTIDRLL